MGGWCPIPTAHSQRGTIYLLGPRSGGHCEFCGLASLFLDTSIVGGAIRLSVKVRTWQGRLTLWKLDCYLTWE